MKRSSNKILSPRLQQVYDLAVRGLRNKEIAARLDLSETVIKVYVSMILSRLKVDSRWELISKSYVQKEREIQQERQDWLDSMGTRSGSD